MAKFKVLREGETDIKSTDIWRFCIHSDYPTQKIYASGQTTLTISAGNAYGIKTLSHSLGYAPTVMAMFEVNGGRYVKIFGDTKMTKNVQLEQYFSVNISTNTIISAEKDGVLATPSQVSVNDIVKFTSRNSGVLPSPLVANTNYYVKAIVDQYQFTISTTQGGATVDITDGGGVDMDKFENVTNPFIADFIGTYRVETTDSNISFIVNPSIGMASVKNNTDINVYYIILYEQI